jgi:hypothetical protein
MSFWKSHALVCFPWCASILRYTLKGSCIRVYDGIC